MQAFNLIRQGILRSLDLSMDRQCRIDSLPTPVVQFHLVPASTGDGRAFGATCGKVVTRKADYFWLALASSDHSG
jgi:hypothetical protein